MYNKYALQYYNIDKVVAQFGLTASNCYNICINSRSYITLSLKISIINALGKRIRNLNKEHLEIILVASPEILA